MRTKTRNILAWSLIPQILVVKGLSYFPGFIESVYSNGIYLWISSAMRFVFGWIPFSIGDIIYTLAGLYLIRWVIKNRRRFIKEFKVVFTEIIATIALLYLAFNVLWGLNYYRLPLHQTLGMDAEYTTTELINVIDILTVKANDLHAQINDSDTIKVTVPYGKQELIKMSAEGFDSLKLKYPSLHPSPISIKRSLYSIPLTYMGFGGYLNPFTNEAQIDGIIPLHKYPVTACHEQAHQIGYAAENEANFIGFLGASYNNDLYFRYSAYIFALKHCLYEIARRDPDMFEEKKKNLRVGILKNYEEERLFWMSYQNPLEPIFKETFNTFLKANSQADGIKSYSYVVALLVNHFKTELTD